MKRGDGHASVLKGGGAQTNCKGVPHTVHIESVLQKYIQVHSPPPVHFHVHQVVDVAT